MSPKLGGFIHYLDFDFLSVRIRNKENKTYIELRAIQVRSEKLLILGKNK